mgnify:CR=1 FL=1
MTIKGIYGGRIKSKNDLSNQAKAVCDSNAVSLNMLPFVVDKADSGKLDDKSNAASAFKSLITSLSRAAEEKVNFTHEARVAVEVMMHLYCYHPELADVVAMQEFIRLTNSTGMFDHK